MPRKGHVHSHTPHQEVERYPFGGILRWALPANTSTLRWLPNSSVVLIPDEMTSVWQDVVYWVTAIIYSLGVIEAGLTSRGEHCDMEGGPGPCYFHYYSHWAYILFAAQFFLLPLARISRCVRWLLYATVWFTVGTVVLWAVMTTALLATTTRGTVEAMLPVEDDADVGAGLLVVIALHYFPFIVLVFVWLPHYGQRIAIFWTKFFSWASVRACCGLGVLFLVPFQTANWFSPLILWAFYLAWWDPYVVYDVSPEFAAHFPIAYLTATFTVFVTGLVLGCYLYLKARKLIQKRLDEYIRTASPSSHYVSRV